MANKKISQFTAASGLQATDKFVLERGSDYLYVTPANFISYFDSDDVSEGATSKYATTSNLDTWLGTKDSDDVTEGSTNLFATNANLNTWFTGKDLDDLAQGTSFKKLSYQETTLEAADVQSSYSSPVRIATTSMTYSFPVAVTVTLTSGSVTYTTTGNTSWEIVPGNGSTYGGTPQMQFPISILTTTTAYAWSAKSSDPANRTDIPMNYDWYIRPDSANVTLGDCHYTIRCWFEEWN